MKVLVTGANGFIGQNLCVALAERPEFEVLAVTRDTQTDELALQVHQANAVIHLAGVNRPEDPKDFIAENRDFTAVLCDHLRRTARSIPVAFASSIQADEHNPYGQSKRAAEDVLQEYAEQTGAGVAIYRLPNVFGKWSRPNYNSAVATFSHNIARGLPIRIEDPQAPLQLVYIDDVIDELLGFLCKAPADARFAEVAPVYETTVGKVAEQIHAFDAVRHTLTTEPVGDGLTRALYSTYLSFLPADDFKYSLPSHGDERGIFVEMLKTGDSGQISYFTAHPGITRGGHYHHTKTEKFLVVKGQALFRFRHILTDEVVELTTDASTPVVVDTIPGWAHDITNVGDDEMIVLLWANEVFDPKKPDTVSTHV